VLASVWGISAHLVSRSRLQH